MTETPPIVLTMAGFDPSGGAGVLADIKTIAAHGGYGLGCVTALTVQSTQGVRRVFPIEPQLVRETLEELASDFEFAAVHIGMLATAAVAEVVADFLAARKPPNVVLDPILKSSSGAELIDGGGVLILRERLLPLAAVITPNVDEAAQLTGIEVRNLDQMRIAAGRLHGMGVRALVVTGGHLDPAVDLLSIKESGEARQEVLTGERVKSNSTHGTGCAFSTALACELALGSPLPEAVAKAKTYVTEAIRKAYSVGRGVGPVNHSFGKSS